MHTRWLLAVGVVIVAVYLTVPGLPVPGVRSLGGEDAEAAAGAAAVDPATGDPAPQDPAAGSPAVCPASAKKANLSFTITDMNGKSVSLASYKGKVILLDFWATWCGPCKAEIPNFVELQNEYGPKGFAVLGLSVDDTVDKLKPFASEFKMNYPVLVGLGRDDVQDAFGPIWGIPTSFLISRDGRICRKNTGIQGKAKYERDIKALL
jgi:thiol-disulfide isomerase/thioredoxin